MKLRLYRFTDWHFAPERVEGLKSKEEIQAANSILRSNAKYSTKIIGDFPKPTLTPRFFKDVHKSNPVDFYFRSEEDI
jgi:hypothetical protein